MPRARTLPSVYVVTWPGIIKVGHTEYKNRWRMFQASGADLFGVWHYSLSGGSYATDHEIAADDYMLPMTNCGISKAEAPWARTDPKGGLRADGYMEARKTASPIQVAEEVGLLLSARGGLRCRDDEACGAAYSYCVTPDYMEAERKSRYELSLAQRRFSTQPSICSTKV